MQGLFTWLTPHRVLLLIGSIAVIWMLYEYLHRKSNRLTAFLLGTFSGIAGLLLCHFFGSRIGFSPPLTLYTLAVSAVAGIPGLLLLAWMQFLKL